LHYAAEALRVIGTRLGQYEITAALGAGGMGEVYRATDARLGRTVAIKVLPARLAEDEPARARFEREARAVAALSHPNILSIYEFGQQNGIAFAVMELLEGETLRARLGRGVLPIRKILQIGADLADGLAAAHEKGIVHRDLKPENVFLTVDGRVKILDFGLARQAANTFSDKTDDALTTLRATDPGTVLGTVGYMAPEQVTGQAADARADIFALGCLLYEMASGHRAFARATAAETMTAILREEPSLPPDSALRPTTFDSVVHRCLEKSPTERFQSARDLAFPLRSIGESTSSGERRLTGGQVRAPVRWWRSRAATMTALTGGAIALLLLGRYTARRVPDTRAGEPVFASFDKVTDEAGVETTPAISPDGKSVVYAKTVGLDTALYLLRVGGKTPLRLSGERPAQDSQPSFSPDGDRIAFRSERDGGGIFLMSATGESITRLTNEGYSPCWSPDGKEIVITPATFATPTDLSGTATGLTVVTITSGQRRALANGWRALQPAWSPGGRRVAFWTVRGQGGQRDIETVAADGSDGAQGGIAVTDDAPLDWSPAWSPDGRSMYFSSARGGTMNVWRVAIDQDTGRLLGEPEPMTTPSIWSGDLSFSRDGSRVAFASLDYRSTLMRVPFDPAREAVTGPAEPVLQGTRPIRDHSLSPDGQWIAFTQAGAQEDLFVARVDGREYRRLTDDSFRDRGPGWSPDGTRIAFYSDRSGAYELWMIRPDGSGLTRLTTSTGNPGLPTWSPDGARIAYGYFTWHIIGTQRVPVDQPPAEPPFSATERFNPLSWSRDGRRLAGPVSPVGGNVSALAIYDLGARRFSRVPGEFGRPSAWLTPMWLADNRRLIVRRPEGIVVVDADAGTGRLLVPVGGYMIGKSVGVSADDRWITYTDTATEGDVWIATVKK